MKQSIDFNKPIRFTRVQDGDHATYRPRLVGSYVNDTGKTRWVVALRYWDSSPSFVVYDETGTPLSSNEATNSTGVFDATLINGPEITTHVVTHLGARVELTFDGDMPAKVRLLK